MKTKLNMPTVIVAFSTLLLVMLVISGTIHADKASRFDYGTRNLVGASPEQVGHFALQYAEAQHAVRSGTPQVLLTRPIKKEEMGELGLGCVGSSLAIEEPPLMLVILKGDFNSINLAGSVNSVARGIRYIAYAFDLWSAGATLTWQSSTGGVFRLVLNDPSLPVEEIGKPLVCPTEVPRTKTWHYGDTVPGIIIPTRPPMPTPTYGQRAVPQEVPTTPPAKP